MKIGHIRWSSFRGSGHPEGLKDSTTFSISTSASDKPIAHLEIQVASIAVEKLAVRYTNQALDDRQDGRARGSDSGDMAPVAVAMPPPLPPKKDDSKPSNVPSDPRNQHVDADASVDPDEWVTAIENTVTLKLPPSLSAISSERDVWIASSSTWPITFSPGSTVEPPRPNASRVPSEDLGLRPNETALYRVQEISFSVVNRQTKPLRMTLALRHLGGPYDPENGDWFTVDVMLASEARYESIPLPLERQLAVSCNSGKYTQSSTTVHEIQMDDDALRTQGCRMLVNPAYAGTLTAFGRQVVKVTVSRTKATAHTSTWNLDRHSSEFILPPPDDDDRGEGPYTVRAEITLDKTVYRSTTDTDVATHPDYVFTATLQPRGKYATFQHARLYGTFPVDVLAMRFPAVMREVDRSSDGSASQLIPFRVGLAVVVEPWDYARNRNPWPVPLQGSIGLSVVELSQKRLAPSFQVGGSILLGTVGEKVPTSVTLGLFYELDLTEPSHGSHFLVTSTVNFLSLFDTK